MQSFRKKFDFLDEMEAKPQRSDKSRLRLFLSKDKKNVGIGSPRKSSSGGLAMSSPKSRKILGKDPEF